MQKILIMYNSGAGSTQTIAEIYYRLLKDYQVDMMPISINFDYSVLINYDLLIFGFPNYHSDLSNLMKHFIANMPIQNTKIRAFAFLTYGLIACNVLRIFIKQINKKNICVADYADYRSPATDGALLVPPFPFMYTYEKDIALTISNDIVKIKTLCSSDNFAEKIPVYKPYTIINYPTEYFGKRLKMTIKVRQDVCINCNLCVRQCPQGCWAENETYPVFSKVNCDTCYRCIHRCPQEALVFSDKTIKKKKLNPSFYKEWKNKIMLQITKNMLD